MKDALDAVFSVLTVLAATFGIGYGLHKVGPEIEREALKKVAQGLSPLTFLAARLTGAAASGSREGRKSHSEP